MQNDGDRHFLLKGKHGFRLADDDNSIVGIKYRILDQLRNREIKWKENCWTNSMSANYVLASSKPSFVSPLAAIPNDDRDVRKPNT